MMFGGKQVVVCGYGEVKHNFSLTRYIKYDFVEIYQILLFKGCENTLTHHSRWEKK